MKWNAIVPLTILTIASVVSIEAFGITNTVNNRQRSSLSMNVQENKNTKDIKVGVIGCGRIGLVHLEAITKAPGVTAIIVSNPTISKAEKGNRIPFTVLVLELYMTLHAYLHVMFHNLYSIFHSNPCSNGLSLMKYHHNIYICNNTYITTLIFTYTLNDSCRTIQCGTIHQRCHGSDQ